MRTGSVLLPLHPGKCPPWLFERMRPLSREICRIIIDEHGTKELLSRLSDPMFFQALGCAIGFDWHSSGVTTTTCGALKEALTQDMGIVSCGGKGKTSKKTPEEIALNSDRFNLPERRRDALLEATRLSAKVDSSCVQDGYELYHHSFFMDEKGRWAVVQQGMRLSGGCEAGFARRYHWLETTNFTEGPPENIAGMRKEGDGSVLNLVSDGSAAMRECSVALVQDNPARLRKYFTGQTTLFDSGAHHVLPARHEILKCDLSEKDWKALQAAYELQPETYAELACLRGMGKKKLRALALLSKLIHGTPLDWKDPVKYSFAHGGKDGIPYPVDRPTYDSSIGFLQGVLADAKSEEKGRALRRLASL